MTELFNIPKHCFSSNFLTSFSSFKFFPKIENVFSSCNRKEPRTKNWKCYSLTPTLGRWRRKESLTQLNNTFSSIIQFTLYYFISIVTIARSSCSTSSAHPVNAVWRSSGNCNFRSIKMASGVRRECFHAEQTVEWHSSLSMSCAKWV